ncbi:MAG TPA: DUF2721 domain-containing protein [Dongiaceae bacterium]|nr:DUF2721 domain-containing protein [Dongiaceae bacterium]
MESNLADIAHIIQLAVAPVFLLTGIGAILGVMTNRLARVVDRTRILEVRILEGDDNADVLRDELKALFRRAVLASRAITLCTATALLICAVIILLFVGDIVGVTVKIPVVTLFVLAMTAFFIGLVYFLREIMLSSSSIEQSARRVLEKRRLVEP